MKEELQLFATRLKELRTMKNLTQLELAEEIGCARSLISDYEHGKKEPGYINILKLSKSLETKIGYLMGE